MKNCEPEVLTVMKPDDFEQRLRQQTWREAPPSWRAEILTAAQAAQSSHAPARRKTGTGTSLIWEHICFWLWPSPRAWGALAAVWLVILGGNLVSNARYPATSGHPMADADLMHNIRQRQRAMAELLDISESAESPANSRPAPRGDLRGTNRMG